MQFSLYNHLLHYSLSLLFYFVKILSYIFLFFFFAMARRSTNEFYNHLWTVPHELSSEIIMHANDFATEYILDIDVDRKVTKFYQNNEQHTLEPATIDALRTMIEEFRQTLPPTMIYWEADDVAKIVDKITPYMGQEILDIIKGKILTMRAVKKQIARYLYAINNRHYEIVPDNRYSQDSGVKVLAKERFGIGVEIPYLQMCMSETLSEE